MKCICCDICKENIWEDGNPLRDYYIIKEKWFPKIRITGYNNDTYRTSKKIMCSHCMTKFKEYISISDDTEATE